MLVDLTKRTRCPDSCPDTSKIPPGSYCYELLEVSPEGVQKVKPCPFWELRKDKPSQDNGYCHYLKRGDWECSELSLLWDGVKECGINDDMEEEDDT